MRKPEIIFSVCILILFFFTGTADAYIGPGAGFAIVTSFLAIIVSFFLAIFYIVTLPVRLLIRMLRRGHFFRKTSVQKIVIIGFDGLDPGLVRKYISEQKLPHLEKLKRTGTFTELRTTTPAISPVAWSSFSTGANPGKHNIYDFLKRNKEAYIPELSSARINDPLKYLKLGKYVIPLKKPVITNYKKSNTFWNILGKNGIFSAVLHVPITFPVEKFFGVQLAGMCVPDLLGTQGTFSFYTSDENYADVYSGGEITYVNKNNNRIETYIRGPQNPFKRTNEYLQIPLIINFEKNKITADVGKLQIDLKSGEFTGWIKLEFKTGLGVKITGICRLFLKSIEPVFELYMTPINIDPERPALPISHPYIFSTALSKIIGNFSTLGISDDTWALNERVIDESAFLKLAYDHHSEKEEIFLNMLKRVNKGVVVNVFDISDTVQHMFFRYIDEKSNFSDVESKKKYGTAIEEVYQKLDNIVGNVLDQTDEKTVLMILSDHGFKSFRRGINLNTWLYENNYLHLKDDSGISEKYFKNVDWSKTRAFALGLGGLYINQKGRESQGIVSPGEEKEKLKKELKEKLLLIKDNETGEKGIQNIYDANDVFDGPYKDNAPDLIIGYSEGFRASWDSVIGKISDKVIEKNEKSWSGDHCIDPAAVPGVFFCNRKIDKDNAEIIDIAPTVLKLFGINPPAYMDGKNLLEIS